MKKNYIAYISLLIVLFLSISYNRSTARSISQAHIASQLIRLHVVANSDSRDDQSNKLLVKNDIVDYLQVLLRDAKDIEEARDLIRTHLPNIQTIAMKTMARLGCYVSVSASLSYDTFPIKQYGDLTLPAGQYEALVVHLGKSEGKNWWCVLFPSLCNLDETYQVISEENKEKFKELLTKEEYESLFTAEQPPVFYKSKIKELFDKVIDYFPAKG